MITTESQTVLIGVFPDRGRAQRFVTDLKQAGFRDDQIGLVTPQAEKAPDTAEETAVAGALSGGAVGGLAGLALATVLLPGLGTVLAGGLLTAVLGGAAVGATAGGVLGALIGLGLSEEEARASEEHLRAGRTLVVVKAPGRYPEAFAILEHVQAKEVPAGGARTTPPPRPDELDKLT
jgi:hypothetical protein